MKQRIWKYSDIINHPLQTNSAEPILVGGCFDLLHFGHITFLKQAKNASINSFLLIALESDEYIKKHKKRTPIHTQDQRAEILSQLRCVDAVVLLPYFTSDHEYERMVQIINPHTIAITEGDPQTLNKQKQAQAIGSTIKVVTKLLSDYSTTTISQQI